MKLEQKTCTLVLKAGGDQGRIFMANGEVINAETGSPAAPTGSGHNAFRCIMAWDLPAIHLTEGVEKVTRQIQLPLMHLLMESQQQIDDAMPDCPGTIADPKAPGAGNWGAGKLGALLSASAGVTAYEVTGPEGDSAGEPFNGLDIPPEQLIAMGTRLGTLLNGRFKSLKINLEDRSSYWAGRINRLNVWVKLKPGFRPGKMTD